MPDAASRTRPKGASESREESPTRVGRYEVLGELGRGGMGVVYLAHDPTLDRDVALKVVRPGWDRSNTSARSRFKREAQALARLSHPNVVSIFDGGVEGDRLFFAMERIHGCDLREWLKSTRSQEEIFEVLTPAGRALEAAHSMGVVHRDFKPQNVMLTNAGNVKVLDFGLAGLIEGGDSTVGDPGHAESDESPPREGLAGSITETGIVMGTPAYLAPEQYRRDKLDGRADQFAFCVTLYEALVGRRPFEGKSMVAIQESILAGRLEQPKGAREISRRTLSVILRGLSSNAEDRYPTMGALLDALARSRARPWPLFVGGAAVVGVGVALSTAAPPPDPCDEGREALERAWGGGRRAEVRQALIDADMPWAQTTADSVVTLLDTYAREWEAEHSRACEVRRSDLTMSCLQGRLADLDAFSQSLAQGDTTAMQSAVMTASGLPAPRECSSRAEIDPPPAQAADPLAAIQEQLGKARSFSGAGRYVEARAATVVAVEEARMLGYAPMLAEALVERADVRASLADAAASERDYTEAYALALGSGDHAMAARAARGLVFVVGIHHARFEDALQWGRHGEAALARLGSDPVAEAALLANIGSVLGERGEIDSAIDHHARALDLESRALGADDVRLAPTHLNFAYALAQDGRLEQAVEHSRRGVEIFEAALGPEHPSVGSAVGSHASRLASLGQHREALPLHRRALEIARGTFEERHPDVGRALRGIAAAHVALGEYDAALAVLQEAVKAEAPNNERDGRARGLDALAEVLNLTGRNDEAVATLRQVLAIRERVLGADHPDVVRALSNLATVLREQDRDDEAIRLYERALELFLRFPQRPTQAEAILRRNLARAYHGAARWDDAALAFEQARPYVAAAWGDESAELRGLDESLDNVVARRH